MSFDAWMEPEQRRGARCCQAADVKGGVGGGVGWLGRKLMTQLPAGQPAALSRGSASVWAQSGECKAFGFGKKSQGSFSAVEFVWLVV